MWKFPHGSPQDLLRAPHGLHRSRASRRPPSLISLERLGAPRSAETFGWRVHQSIDASIALDFESSSSSRRHTSRLRHPFPSLSLSLSVRQTLFNLDAAASEHALGQHVHCAPPPVAQERCGVWTRGTRKSVIRVTRNLCRLHQHSTRGSLIEHFPSPLTRGPPLL